MNTLGIDLGTSELKLLLLGEDGAVIATAGAPLQVQRPQPLWSEQHPQDWWQALEAAVATLRAAQPVAWHAVRAIGLSGQMHGAVPIDAQGAVLRPAILWNDGRSEAECTELLRRVPDLHQRAGNLAMPGFTAPKLLWLQHHEPAVFGRVAHVLLPKDWLRLRLTSRLATDPSDAAGTLWLDPARRGWDDTLLAACGLSTAHMPELVDGGAVSGELLPALTNHWGLSTGVVVAGGAGDNAASAVGIGAVTPGQGFVSLGTSGVIFVVTDRHRPNVSQAVHAFCHTLPQRWHQMSVMLSAAASLAWLTRLVGATSEAELLAPLEQGAYLSADAAPLFLPYLSGERTPHNNPRLRAQFHGLDAAHGRHDMAYAVLEGVAFGLAQGMDALRAAGTTVKELAAVGGGAHSPFWLQLLADALQCNLHVPANGHAGAALGAARLGRLALGEDEASVCRTQPSTRVFEPRPNAFLRERQLRFAELVKSSTRA